MLRIIEGLPPDTIGVSATGTITPKEYREIFIPVLKKRAPHISAAKLLFVTDGDFRGFAPKAAWPDAEAVRIHAHVTRAAIVTALPWLRSAAGILSPLFSGGIKTFSPADLPAAMQWLADGHGERNFLENEVFAPSFADIGQIVDAEDARPGMGLSEKPQGIRRRLRKLLRPGRENRSDARA